MSVEADLSTLAAEVAALEEAVTTEVATMTLPAVSVTEMSAGVTPLPSTVARLVLYVAASNVAIDPATVT